MDTQVYLLNVPLENDQKHTLYFTSKEEQKTYFESRIVKEYKNSSYQRKDSIIRVPDNYDNISPSVNYVMYKNPSFSNKWFYAFIKEIEYKNTETTWIHIETDVIQTWLFDYNIKTSFVEREHVLDDTVGLHTVPEGLETGDFVVNNVTHGLSLNSISNIIVGATIDLANYETGLTKDKYPNINGNLVGGVYSGIKYYEFPNVASLNLMLKNVATAGQSDAINCIFMGNNHFYDTEEVEGKAYRVVKDSGSAKTKEFDYVITENNEYKQITTPSKPTTIDGYTPRNKKLLAHPYCYLYVSNNSGGSAIYKYERFKNDKTEFEYVGCLTPGMSIRFRPLNYDGQAINNDEAINCGKLPICSWNTDVYTNWLTQNSVNIGLSIGSNLITMAGGLAMAGTGAGALMGAGTVVSGAMGIASSLGQVYQQSLIPPQAEGNINNGDVTAGSGFLRMSLFEKSIKHEYAEILDGFFDMFGYKVNKVKIPNKAHRSRYWYTKTIDINIDGAIPNNDMQKIKDCYNNGITFWRNANEIQDYSLSNGIV